jgi:hypothetical protein
VQIGGKERSGERGVERWRWGRILLGREAVEKRQGGRQRWGFNPRRFRMSLGEEEAG